MLLLLLLVVAEDVAVVFCALVRVGEDAVGLAHAHEAPAGVGVRRVVVWVVGLGKGVK